MLPPLVGSHTKTATDVGKVHDGSTIDKLFELCDRTLLNAQFPNRHLAQEIIHELEYLRAQASGKTFLPVPKILYCPGCELLHVDYGEWATVKRTHETHLCQYCRHEFKPFAYPTVGIHLSEVRS